jgi:hypothetical protein
MSVRYGAIAGIAGGTATALSGVAIEAIVKPSTTVSDQMWSYPWTSDTFVPVTVAFAGFHLLVFLGVLAFARSGAAGSGRTPRIGTTLALVGTAVFFLAELASLPISTQRMDDTGPGIVGAVFGLGVLLTAVGLVVAGLATRRAGQWRDWRRFVPLAAGIWSTALLFLSFTPALAVGVSVYGLFMAALGLAVYPRPSSAIDESRTPTTRATVLH